MTAAPVMSITEELIAELELAAFKATKGSWCTNLESWVCASDSDQLNNGFVLAVCEGPDANNNADYVAKAGPLLIRALLAERAELKVSVVCLTELQTAVQSENDELKRDAERYRWLRDRLAGASFDWDGEGMTVLVFQMPDSITVSANCDKVVDDAMQAAK